MFFPPECELLFCSSAHSNRGRSAHFLSSTQPPVVLRTAWGEIFTFRGEDPPLEQSDPSVDSSLDMSASYNKVTLRSWELEMNN